MPVDSPFWYVEESKVSSKARIIQRRVAPETSSGFACSSCCTGAPKCIYDLSCIIRLGPHPHFALYGRRMYSPQTKALSSACSSMTYSSNVFHHGFLPIIICLIQAEVKGGQDVLVVYISWRRHSTHLATKRASRAPTLTRRYARYPLARLEHRWNREQHQRDSRPNAAEAARRCPES